MEWHDEAMIIGLRKQGETGVLVELMTHYHGRYVAFVRGGRSRSQHALLQPGNHVRAHWRARLQAHLGVCTLEAVQFVAAKMMACPLALYGIQTAASHLRLLPERDAHPFLYETLVLLFEKFSSPKLFGMMILYFELLLLQETGFGLDLTCCTLTGKKEDLAYVSPKSARAVSRVAGQAWKDKLLPLPGFLYQNRSIGEEDMDRISVSMQDFRDGFMLTGFFIEKHLCKPRGIALSALRTRLVKQLLKECFMK